MEQLRRGGLAGRTVAKGGVGRLEQPAVFLQRRLRPLLPSLLVQEFLGDLAERVAAGRAGHLLHSALETRILPAAKQLAGSLPTVAGLGERYLRIMAERDLLLLALEAIGNAPMDVATFAGHGPRHAIGRRGSQPTQCKEREL